MRYLRKFNEELSPYTYYKASKSLDSMGHKKRAEKLMDWYGETRRREELRAIENLKKELSNTPVFKMSTYKGNWDQRYSKFNREENPHFEGNFYLDVYFEYEWFFENEDVFDFMNDKGTIQFSFGISLFPADEETLNYLKENDFEMWRNKIYTNTLTIRLNDDNTPLNQEKSKTFWEESGDCGYWLFANRREAVKFKRFLIDSLNTDNNFHREFMRVKEAIKSTIDNYNNRDIYFLTRPNKNNENKEGYDSNGVPNEIPESDIKIDDRPGWSGIYYWSFGDKECPLKESDYQYFEKAVKKMSINNLHKD